MDINDPAAQLYDKYTKEQLTAIAEHNDIKVKSTFTKLQVAEAIVNDTDGKYTIPEVLPLAKKIPSSRLKSLRGEARNAYRDEHRELRKKEYEAAYTPEELETNEDYQRMIRFIGDKPEKDPNEKIAVYSDRNISWDEVGKLTKGYNFVTREASEKWLRLRGVRKATPEEVATHFDL